jgi:cytochrome b
MHESADDRVYIWDPFVRIFHWTLVVTFTVAFFTDDDTLAVHVWAGYAVGVLIPLRVIWGLVGPRHARFTDFLYAPPTVVAYVRDLLSFRAPRYIGHSPGGGAMIVVLLFSLAVTVVSGLVVYAAEEQAGPLAGLAAAPSREVHLAAWHPVREIARKDEDEEHEEDEREEEEAESALGEAMEELHEFFANFTLAQVIVHVAAVLLASVVHRENLIRAMITGYKRT